MGRGDPPWTGALFVPVKQRQTSLEQNVSTLMPEPHCSLHAQYMASYVLSASPSTQVIGRTRLLQGKRRDGVVFPLTLEVQDLHGTGSVLP